MLLTETASSARDSLAAPLRRLSARIFGGRGAGVERGCRGRGGGLSLEAPPTKAESFSRAEEESKKQCLL